jgi:hypothetical protein
MDWVRCELTVCCIRLVVGLAQMRDGSTCLSDVCSIDKLGAKQRQNDGVERNFCSTNETFTSETLPACRIKGGGVAWMRHVTMH